VRRTITSLERRIELDRTRDTTRDELDRAHMRLLPYTAQRAEARQASARFRSALAEVYRDPTQARRTFHARAEQVGAPTAGAEMARHPGRFGELKGTQVGPIRSAERTAALRTASKLETLGTEHIRRVREAWDHRAEYRRERTAVVRLERELKTINHELGRSPGRAALEQRLGRQIQGLERPTRQALLRTLPVPQQRLLAAAAAVGRAFAHEQGHDR
jgi:hypothetical protein